MALIDWGTRLETGHREIDEQHRDLVGLVNQLHSASLANGRKGIAEALRLLQDHTVSHFQMEERLMDQTQYLGGALHKDCHHNLLNQLADLISGFQKGAFTLTLSDLHFLRDWLIKHIQNEDALFADYFRKVNGPQVMREVGSFKREKRDFRVPLDVG